MGIDGRWQLCICASGHLSIRMRGTINPDFPSALPIWGADKASEVENMMVLIGRHQWQDDSYVCSLDEWTPGDVDSIPAVEARIEELANVQGALRKGE